MSITGRLNIGFMYKAMKGNKVLTATRLAVRTSPAEIKSYFENYGPVEQVYRNIDVNIGVYSGPAFIQFQKEETPTNIQMQRNHFIDNQEIELYPCNYLPNEVNVNLRKKLEKEKE